MIDFETYFNRVLEQLECCATEEYKKEYVVYTYPLDVVMNNVDYFERCRDAELSAYKALLFFHDYLNGEVDI